MELEKLAFEIDKIIKEDSQIKTAFQKCLENFPENDFTDIYTFFLDSIDSVIIKTLKENMDIEKIQ